jgi:hypothetical protein
MKIIEGMKKLKDLIRKSSDIRSKIQSYSADMDTDTPVYKTAEDQKAMVGGWLQAHFDITREIERIRVAITFTNVTTEVAIEMEGGKNVTKTIQGWILRRRELAKVDQEAWNSLTTRNLKDTAYRPDAKSETVMVSHVRRYYDQAERDKMVAMFMAEPARIDGALEVFNAVTELVFPEE